MRIIFIALALTSFVLANNILWAEERLCTAADQEAVDNAISHLTRWQNVYEAYRAYRHCDDGYIAEGFSDGIVKLLANNWETLSEMSGYIERDSHFREFVLGHIDATTSDEDLNRIIENTDKSCPSGKLGLCANIRREATRAIDEIKSVLDE